jgi:ubiquinone/menaquinone biosynthesis C-methylase UbiE
MRRPRQQTQAPEGADATRWELSDAERDSLAAEGRYGAGDVLRALLSRPSLAPRVLRRALRGAGQGLRDDPELAWYLHSRRLRKRFPDVATGAGWYDEDAFTAALEPYLGESTRAIEIGCGAGRLMRLVAPKVAELVGCDLSEPMIEEAERNLSGLDNVAFVRAEAGELAQLGYADFDLAFAHDLLVNLDLDPALAVLDAMRGVLRSGGTCVVSVLTVDEEPWGREHMELIRGAPAGGRVGAGHPRPYVRAQVDTMMKMAGFEISSAGHAEGEPAGARPHYIVAGRVPA